METFTALMSIISKVVIGGGTIMIVWGAVTFGGGLKDKAGPEIQQGIWTMLGGVVITLAGAYLTTVTFA